MSKRKYPVYDVAIFAEFEGYVDTRMRVFDSHSYYLLLQVVRRNLFGLAGPARFLLTLHSAGDYRYAWNPEWRIPLAFRPDGRPSLDLYVPASLLVLSTVYDDLEPGSRFSHLPLEKVNWVPLDGSETEQLFAVQRSLVNR